VTVVRYMLVRCRLDGGVHIVTEEPWMGPYEVLAAGSQDAMEAAKRLIGEYYTPVATHRWVIR
jgi:hypothetical protein